MDAAAFFVGSAFGTGVSTVLYLIALGFYKKAIASYVKELAEQKKEMREVIDELGNQALYFARAAGEFYAESVMLRERLEEAAPWEVWDE